MRRCNPRLDFNHYVLLRLARLVELLVFRFRMSASSSGSGGSGSDASSFAFQAMDKNYDKQGTMLVQTGIWEVSATANPPMLDEW